MTSDRSSPLLIFAGNYRQAQDHARRSNLRRDAWVYVNDTRTLLGRRGAVVTRVGTWYERPDSIVIERELRRIGAVVADV